MPNDPVNQETEVTPEVVITPSAEHKSPEVEVELNPSQKAGVGAPDPTEKLKNQMFYEQRQLEKRLMAQQRQMMDELAQRISGSNSQTQKVREQLDEFDEEVEKVAQTDWRKAVDMRAERIAEKKLEEKLKAEEEKRKQNEFIQEVTRVEIEGRNQVISEFPEIVDESSPEFKAYMDIYNRRVNKSPTFMNNPYKHEIILPELREKLGKRTMRVEADPEVERLKRVAAGSSVPSRTQTKSESIMLTQDEIEMCKKSGIPVKTYARNKSLGMSGLKEGVVCDE